jgi:hypothetical protein
MTSFWRCSNSEAKKYYFFVGWMCLLIQVEGENMSLVQWWILTFLRVLPPEDGYMSSLRKVFCLSETMDSAQKSVTFLHCYDCQNCLKLNISVHMSISLRYDVLYSRQTTKCLNARRENASLDLFQRVAEVGFGLRISFLFFKSFLLSSKFRSCYPSQTSSV